MARYLFTLQCRQIQEGIGQVISRLPSLRKRCAIVLGSGSFLGLAAARSVGLEIGTIADDLRPQELAVAPCLAVAQLLDEHLRSGVQ